jgi:hypothetical protein
MSLFVLAFYIWKSSGFAIGETIKLSAENTILPYRLQLSVICTGRLALRVAPHCQLATEITVQSASALMSQILVVLSHDINAGRIKSYEKAVGAAQLRWPFSVPKHAPLLASQTYTLPSFDADPSQVEFRENATDSTHLVWPSNAYRSVAKAQPFSDRFAPQKRSLTSFRCCASLNNTVSLNIIKRHRCTEIMCRVRCGYSLQMCLTIYLYYCADRECGVVNGC